LIGLNASSTPNDLLEISRKAGAFPRFLKPNRPEARELVSEKASFQRFLNVNFSEV
jgi:hypothetical protein